MNKYGEALRANMTQAPARVVLEFSDRAGKRIRLDEAVCADASPIEFAGHLDPVCGGLAVAR
ncbi:hypothetical protein [Mycolicibacterium sphagni]|uniref:Uncharacterized protein n=1 Tax=Mycolicibacterium sphagni TaxID=1786 RepID=A0ABX2K4L5_9MYCO|nr:hypothetical protein [Mycolicibacterium sphagni]NTY62687.1 hypothetical protein [Mycolicibacterium sphagni]